MGTGRPPGRPSTKPKKKPGRPKKGDLPAVPENTQALQEQEELTQAQKNGKKGGRPRGGGGGSGKLSKISKDLEKILDDMIKAYQRTGGLESTIKAIEEDGSFKKQFHKEMQSMLRKYLDLKIAEMKIAEGFRDPGDGGNGYNGPQNVFIINGLQNVNPDVQGAIDRALKGEKVIEAQFSIVGLDRE